MVMVRPRAAIAIEVSNAHTRSRPIAGSIEPWQIGAARPRRARAAADRARRWARSRGRASSVRPDLAAAQRALALLFWGGLHRIRGVIRRQEPHPAATFHGWQLQQQLYLIRRTQITEEIFRFRPGQGSKGFETSLRRQRRPQLLEFTAR